MRYITGPDFPTGGFIIGHAGIREAYETGRGLVLVRAKAHTEELKRATHGDHRHRDPLPGEQGHAHRADRRAGARKKIDEISRPARRVRPQGMRIVIELKREAMPKVVLNKLYKHTAMQTTFGVIMLALVDGVPRTLTLQELLQAYIDHRSEVIVRRTRFELDKAEKRAHILEGLLIALDNLDEVIRIIRSRRGRESRQDGASWTRSGSRGSRPRPSSICACASSPASSATRSRKSIATCWSASRTCASCWRRSAPSTRSSRRTARDQADVRRRPPHRDRPDEDEIDIEDMIAEEEMVISITDRATSSGCRSPPTARRTAAASGSRGWTSKRATTSSTSSSPRPTTSCCSSPARARSTG